MKDIFDTHAHYDDEAFEEDRDTLLKSLFEQGVCNIINVGTDIASSKNSVELAKKYEQIFAGIGVHPHCIENLSDDYLEKLKNLSKESKVVAIGEIGLDYHYDNPQRDRQKEIFEAQLILSKALDLPVIIHSRDAAEDTLNILKKHRPKGVIHCFSGSVETAREILKLGLYIGIGGVVTFKNAKNQVNVVREMPLDKLLSETDAPYMAPTPFRAKRCDSSMIKYTAAKIAELRDITAEEVLKKTRCNAEELFLRRV